MDWYKIILTQQQIQLGHGTQILFDFAKAQVAAGAPPHLALFSEKVPTYTLPETFIYFVPPNAMPSCSAFLSKWRAEPCGKPEKGTLALDAGAFSDLEYWDLD